MALPTHKKLKFECSCDRTGFLSVIVGIGELDEVIDWLGEGVLISVFKIISRSMTLRDMVKSISYSVFFSQRFSQTNKMVVLRKCFICRVWNYLGKHNK